MSIIHNKKMVYLPFRVIHLKRYGYSSPRFFGKSDLLSCFAHEPAEHRRCVVSCHPGNISQPAFPTRKQHGTQADSDDPSLGRAPRTPNTTSRKFLSILAAFPTLLFILLFYQHMHIWLKKTKKLNCRKV